MIARSIAGLLVAALLAAAGWWAYDNFERVKVEEYVGPSPEARRNDLLALERLYAKLGMRVRSAESITALDRLPAKSVLVLASRRQGISPQQRDRILKWIAEGGLAIIDAEWPDEPDPLFDALAIDRDANERSAREASEIALPGLERKLRVELGRIGTIALYDGEALFELADPTGGKVIGLAHGAGRVVAFITFDMFTNRAIGRADHATFAAELVRWHAREVPGAVAEVLVYNRPGKLSLWSWLLEHASTVIASLAVLVLMWLWRVAIRFGPIAPDPAPGERKLIDHIAASGRFAWRNAGAAMLLEASRTSALVRLRRIAPELAAATGPERAALVARAADLPRADAERACNAAGAVAAHEFLDRVTLHQRIQSAVARRLAARKRTAPT